LFKKKFLKNQQTEREREIERVRSLVNSIRNIKLKKEEGKQYYKRIMIDKREGEKEKDKSYAHYN